MKRFRINLLTDKAFLTGLIILLINDLILKYQFPGFVTGKLSDVSGLFIFPFFWSIFFEKHRFKIYVLTIVGFVFWKLPVSEETITLINQGLGTRFQRVADHTDLWTLFVVPVSWFYLNRCIKQSNQQVMILPVFPAMICIVSLYAFAATSVPRKTIEQHMPINEALVCKVGKAEVFRSRLRPYRMVSDSLNRNLSDSLFRITFYSGRIAMSSWVRIYATDSVHTVFQIDSLDSYTIIGTMFSGIHKSDVKKAEQIGKPDFVDVFKKKVIDVIEDKSRSGAVIYFDNPKLDPRIR